MAGMSLYLANKLLDHYRGVTAYTMPVPYVALTTTASNATTAGTETTYTNYTRVAMAGTQAAASAGSGTNNAPISFPQGGATGATIVGWATFDAPTGGNLLEFGSCSLAVSSGITPQFANGQLTHTLG